MPDCAKCGQHLRRRHRMWFEKLLFSDVYTCDECGHRARYLRPALKTRGIFLFSRHTHCVRCGSPRVQRLAKRDRIDSVSKLLPSQLFRVMGAPVHKCVACRLQYYDWRPIDRHAQQAS